MGFLKRNALLVFLALLCSFQKLLSESSSFPDEAKACMPVSGRRMTICTVCAPEQMRLAAPASTPSHPQNGSIFRP